MVFCVVNRMVSYMVTNNDVGTVPQNRSMVTVYKIARVMTYISAAEGMVCVPKVIREKSVLAHSIHCYLRFLPDQPCYSMSNIYVGVQTTYSYHHNRTMLPVNILYKPEAAGNYCLPKQAS
jgi:hypothetical protein